MERYGQLLGCDKEGRYITLRESSGLMDFFTRCGAPSPAIANSKIQNSICKFERMPDYSHYCEDNYPMAFCYAPTHLSKLGGTYSATKPIYAVSVSGSENKARDTSYSCLSVMSQAEIMSNGGYNYLDHIFGTPMVTWKQIADVREKDADFDCRMTPEKVIATITPAEAKLVAAIVAAIYSQKMIEIRLKSGCDFNRCSMELLKKVYSLLPAKLAAETGFATYQTPGNARNLNQTTGIRIFVNPADAQPLPFGTDCVLFDLNGTQPIPILNAEVVRSAGIWGSLPFDVRYECIRKIYSASEPGFMEPEPYIAATTEFLKSYQQLNNLEKSKTPIKDVKELKSQYKMIPMLNMGISFLDTAFRRAVNRLLPKGVTLETMKSDAAGMFLLSDTDEEQKAYAAEYSFLHGLITGDRSQDSWVNDLRHVLTAAAKKSKKDVVKVRADLDKQITALQSEMASKDQQHLLALNQKEQTHKTQMETLQQEHDQQLTHLQQAAAAQLQQKQQELNQKQEEQQRLNQEHQNQVAALNQEHQNQVAALTQEHQNQVANLKEAHTQALAEQQQNLKASYQGEIDAAQQAAAEANAKAVQLQTNAENLQARNNQMQQELTSARSEAERTKQTLQSLNSRIESDQVKINNLKKENENLKNRVKHPEADGDMVEDAAVFSTPKNKPGVTKEMAIVGGIGLAVGIVLSVLVFLIVGLFTKDPEPPTVPETTIAATEQTTVPPTTAKPTTEPTTEPTTVPTTEPEAQIAPEDLDWAALKTSEKLKAVETKPNQAQNLLNAYALNPEEEIVAIFTTDADGFKGEKGTALPESFAVLTQVRKDEPSKNEPTKDEPTKDESRKNEDTETEPTRAKKNSGGAGKNTGIPALADEAALVLESGDVRIYVFGGQRMQTAAFGVFDQVADAEDVRLTANLAEDKSFELSALINGVAGDERWWNAVRSVSEEDKTLLNGKNELSSKRMPTLAVNLEDGVIYLYDYRDDPETGKEFVGLMRKHDRKCAVQKNVIAVLASAEEPDAKN